MALSLPGAPPHSVTLTIDGAAFPIVGMQSLTFTDEVFAATIEVKAECLEHLRFDQFSRIKVEIRIGEGVRNFLVIRCRRIAADKIWLDCVDPSRWPCEHES